MFACQVLHKRKFLFTCTLQTHSSSIHFRHQGLTASRESKPLPWVRNIEPVFINGKLDGFSFQLRAMSQSVNLS